MDVIKCPKCGEYIEINIKNSITEDGEVYQCPNCKWPIRYVDK